MDPSRFGVCIGTIALCSDPSSNMRVENFDCAIGIILDVDYICKKIIYMTLEYDEEFGAIYCKKNMDWATLDNTDDEKYFIPFKEMDAKHYIERLQDDNYADPECEFLTNLEAKILASAKQALIKFYRNNNSFPDLLPYIYGVSSSRSVRFGDGGMIHLKFPIFICDHLKIDEAQAKLLRKELKKIGKEAGDYRENEPIQNVIDPELYALRLDRNKFVEEYSKLFDRCPGAKLRKLDDFNQIVKKNYFIRGHYQWLPTIFTQSRSSPKKKNTIKIISPIHNIGSHKKYKKLYSAIETVFENMLPMFDRFPAFKNREHDAFQVVVKSQRYAIQCQRGYSGHWHTEGLTENIAFVGLYFFEWNKGLLGGNMKFRAKHAPQQWYGNESWSCFEVECGENAKGKAIVFDNRYFVHRVRMLKNLERDKKIRKKGFLAFFIVDPENELKETTKTISSLKREDYVDILYKIMLESYKMPQMNISLCQLVVDYADCGITLEEAKRRRKEVIELKKNTKSDFKSINFGNCGEQFYFPMGKAMRYKIMNEKDDRPWLVDAENQGQTLNETHSDLRND